MLIMNCIFQTPDSPQEAMSRMHREEFALEVGDKLTHINICY